MPGFFKGFWVTILRDITFSGSYFGFYELFKYTAFKNVHEDKVNSHIVHFLCGASAGTASTMLSIPFDVIKTRMQTEGQLPEEMKKYKNIKQTFSLILRNEGLWAFYRGLGPRLATTIPSASITFTAYEFFRKKLKVWHWVDE